MWFLPLVVLAALAQQELEPVDSPELVPVPVPSGPRASLPAPVRGADGVVRMSWVERDEGGAARLLLATLTPAGFDAPRLVARGDDWFVNWADFPTSAALADGTLVAAWLCKSGEGTYAYGVEHALSHDGGDTWTAPAWLHEDRSPSEHGFVSLLALDEERFLAVWLDGRDTAAARGAPGGHGAADAGAQALWSRTIGRDGTLGPELRIDARTCECCQTSLVASGDGSAVAAWRDRSADEVRDVAFARFADDAWGPVRLVHADGWELFGCPVNGPRLAPTAGGLTCVWHTGAEPAGTYFARLGPSESAFLPPRRVDGGASEGRVDAVALDDGSVLVTWLEHGESGVAWRGRVLAADGEPRPPFTIAPTDSDRRSGFLRAASLPGGALLAWTDRDAGRVRAARLTLR